MNYPIKAQVNKSLIESRWSRSYLKKQDFINYNFHYFLKGNLGSSPLIFT